MDGMLSQEEINALLGGLTNDTSDAGGNDKLTPEEKDAIGEISNICMGTAATTLYSLVNQKVIITTPVVEITDWKKLTSEYGRPCVFINILYKEGIDGNNLLILKEDDVKVITDLMMGGDGLNPANELTELHFSAICEAMNQMMGSAATSMSSMLNCKIDISPPKAELINMEENVSYSKMGDFGEDDFVRVSFEMKIGELVDSTIMQLYPLKFAKALYHRFSGEAEKEETKQPVAEAKPEPQPVAQQPMMNSQPMMQQQTMNNQQMMGMPMMQQQMASQQDVNVQNVQFQAFNPMVNPVMQQENIDLIMDVPLEVSVVLGRTRKSIKEILEFAPGTIIELDKLAGEPIDVMVNQKLVAKGEVVVIEESFGIRITEIIKGKI